MCVSINALNAGISLESSTGTLGEIMHGISPGLDVAVAVGPLPGGQSPPDAMVRPVTRAAS